MWSTGEWNGKPLQYPCLENHMNSMKRQKDRTLKDDNSLERIESETQIIHHCQPPNYSILESLATEERELYVPYKIRLKKTTQKTSSTLEYNLLFHTDL